MKVLSQPLHSILTFFRNHFQNYCNVVKAHNGVNAYWSITNSQQAIDMLDKQKYSGARTLTVADFSMLNTKLPHSVVKDCTFSALNLCTKNAKTSHIAFTLQPKISKIRKIWYNKDNGHLGNNSLSLDEVKQIVHLVLNETYVQFAGILFKQTWGGSNGGNASPCWLI